MLAKPRWLLAISDAVSQLENLDRTLLTRRDVERLRAASGWQTVQQGPAVSTPAGHTTTR